MYGSDQFFKSTVASKAKVLDSQSQSIDLNNPQPALHLYGAASVSARSIICCAVVPESADAEFS